MKRWAWITVGLYGLLLLALTLPVCFLGSLGYGSNGWGFDIGLRQAGAIFQQWGYWVWLTVLILAQALLLLVPVSMAERRLPSRRKLFVPVVLTSFLLANLALAGGFTLLAAFMGDDAASALLVPAGISEHLTVQIPPLVTLLQATGLAPTNYVQFF